MNLDGGQKTSIIITACVSVGLILISFNMRQCTESGHRKVEKITEACQQIESTRIAECIRAAGGIHSP